MKETKKKLESLGEKVLKDIEKKQNPYLDIPIRSLSNIIYDEKTGMLTLGEKSAKRFLFHTGHAKKFTQTMMVAAFCRDLLKENIHTSLRDMFYNLKRTFPNSQENTFDEEAESNSILVDLEVALNTLREQLHLNADIRGRVVGDVIIKDRGDTVNWSKLGSGGWAIPSNVEEIVFKKVNADFILCIPPDEEIVAKINDSIQSMSAKELYEKYLENQNIFLIGFDDKLTPKFQKLNFMQKRPAKIGENLIRIESTSGSSICLSENHKVPVLTENGIETRLAKEIKTGDYILEAKNLKILNSRNDSIKLDIINFLIKKFPEKLSNIYVLGEPVLEVLKSLKFDWWINKKEELYQELVNSWKKNMSMPLSYYLKFERDINLRVKLRLYSRGSPRSKSIPAVILFDSRLSKLLGYYVAEGHTYKGIPVFTFGKNEQDYQLEVISLIKEIFGINPRTYKLETKYSSVQIYCGNKILGFLFEDFCGKYAFNKKVPQIIFSLDSYCKLAFLEGYINGDGCRIGSVISVATVSEVLANQVRLLLRFIGIPSYKQVVQNDRGFKNYKKRVLYRVNILVAHWNYECSSKSRSLWDRAPLFVVDDKKIRSSSKKSFNIYALASKMSFQFIHPVQVRKVELLKYEGEYYELVSVEPNNVFLHSNGMFTHNCIEKNAAFERLHEDKFWQKNKCILITTQGQAARGTRRLIQRLAIEFNLPVYVFTDMDAYGLYIYSVLKYGSMSLAHVSDRLGTPNAKFLGLTMDDVDKFKLHNFTIRAEEVDIKRAQEMLKYEWFQKPEWQRFLKSLIQRKIKAELESLSGRGLKFMTEEYLPTKIKNKDFLD